MWSGALQDEVGGVQVGVPAKLDLHVGHLVVVDRELDDGVLALEKGAYFAGFAREGAAADPGEGLVAGRGRVGVDQVQINLVVAHAVEFAPIANDVALAGPGERFVDGRVEEYVTPALSREPIHPGPAADDVVAAAGGHDVDAALEEDHIG